MNFSMKRFGFVLIILLFANFHYGEDSNMQKPNIPRPEYPRPQMVRDEWINLNGEWEFEFDNSKTGEEKEFFKDKSFSKKIIVPFCPESPLSGIGEKDFIPSVWYKRNISIPEKWNGKRVFLNFGAVDFETILWINGNRVGNHIGGYSSFSFEITKHIKQGENVVVVCAKDDTRSQLQATGKQSHFLKSHGCMYTRTTGIWQTVWLEAVPQTFIKNFKYYPDIENGKINIQVKTDGYKPGMILKTIVKADGKETGTSEVKLSDSAYISIDLKEKKLWSPTEPFLYDIEFELIENSKTIDVVKSYFGLRENSIDGKNVLLNGKKIFQRLVLDQGYYPDGIYTASSDEALKKDIEISMAAGFNGARLHQKVFEARFLFWADKLGYIVWGEYPNWGLDHANSAVISNVLMEWIEVVERDFNHPAIVGWCPLNETPGNQDVNLMKSLLKATKSIDSTRPIIDTSGYVHADNTTDIYDSHNYEQDPVKFAKAFEDFKNGGTPYMNYPDIGTRYNGEPYFVSEYGGARWSLNTNEVKSWGYGNAPKTEQEFIDRYKALTDVLLSNKNMFAFCYTQLYDVEQEQNGLYTFERKPKFDMSIFKKINTQQAEYEK